MKILLSILTAVTLLHGKASSAAVSVYAGQVAPLLPEDATLQEVQRGTDLSFRIDDLVLRILKSETGRIFCGAVSDSPEMIRRAFFINEGNVSKAASVCRGRFAVRQIFAPWPKRYFLVSTRSTEFPADGWTTPRNETFLFVAESEFNDDRLLRTLAHELSVSLDRKEQFGFGGFTRLAQLGIQEEEASCSIIPLVRQGLMKQSMTALRAFDMERKISEELAIPLSPRFANWSGKTCAQKIVFMSKHLERFKSSIAPEALINLLMDQTSCSMKPANFSSVEDAAIVLEKTMIRVDGKTISACDYFTDGIGFVPGISFRGGPAPRIGGGGW